MDVRADQKIHRFAGNIHDLMPTEGKLNGIYSIETEGPRHADLQEREDLCYSANQIGQLYLNCPTGHPSLRKLDYSEDRELADVILELSKASKYERWISYATHGSLPALFVLVMFLTIRNFRSPRLKRYLFATFFLSAIGFMQSIWGWPLWSLSGIIGLIFCIIVFGVNSFYWLRSKFYYRVLPAPTFHPPLKAYLYGFGILAICLAIVVLYDGKRLYEIPGKQHLTRLTIKELQRGLALFFRDCNRLPNSLNELTDPPTSCSVKPFTYADISDGWGRPFAYKTQGYIATIRSLGSDGKEGGLGQQADISENWVPEMSSVSPVFQPNIRNTHE